MIDTFIYGEVTMYYMVCALASCVRKGSHRYRQIKR